MQLERKESVHKIVENNNCMGCGFCEPLCPPKIDAIRVKYDQQTGQYLPIVDDSKCIECGICLKMCPGEEFDFDKFNIIQFGKIPGKDLLGNYIGTFTGYSTNVSVRTQGASGGVAMQLAALALEEKLVDGFLVVTLDEENPLEPKFILAENAEDLFRSQKSLYCPVPLGVAVRKILHNDMKVGLVGLPCHIHGLRKSQVLSKRLRNRVVLTFGLFCFGTTRRTGTEYFLKRHGVNIGDVASLTYREGGYPGKIKVTLKDQSEKLLNRGFEIPKTNIAEHIHFWISLRYPFYMQRCFSCIDGTAELADIAFGDPWLPEFKDEKLGRSLLVVRSTVGSELVKMAESKALIKLEEISAEKVILSQGNGECITATKDVKSKKWSKWLFLEKFPEYKSSNIKKRANTLSALYYAHQILINKISYNERFNFLLFPLSFLIYSVNFAKRKFLRLVSVAATE